MKSIAALFTFLGGHAAKSAERPNIAQRLAASLAEWRKELMHPVFPGSSVKDEDWGPGGANQRNNSNAVKKPNLAQ